METPGYQKTKHKMAIRRPRISIITLNINGQKPPIKRLRVAEWIKKQNPTICASRRHISVPTIIIDSK